MQAKGWTIFRVLLNKYHPDYTEQMLRALPSEEIKAVISIDVDCNEPEFANLSSEQSLENIHYSWIIKALDRIPEPLRRSTIASLPKSQASKIFAMLDLNAPAKLPTPIGKSYLLNNLFAFINNPDVLPAPFLPETSLSLFADLTKNQIIQIADLLSIYDLTAEVRHVIDKEKLKVLLSGLSVKERQFLRVCLHQKEKISATPLNLKQWVGNPQQLRKMLHRRGLTRLGRALCGQHPDLIWHITHMLDTGRGAVISKNYTSAAMPSITPALVQQVLNVIDFLEIKVPS